MSRRTDMMETAKKKGLKVKGNISNADLERIVGADTPKEEEALVVPEIEAPLPTGEEGASTDDLPLGEEGQEGAILDAPVIVLEEDGTEDELPTIEDLKLTADDLGISYVKNSTPEFLIAKISEAREQNMKDEGGKYFKVVGENDIFILSMTYLKGVPYRLDEWSNNKAFMVRFNAQIDAGTLEII